jgi:hypothetical protein
MSANEVEAHQNVNTSMNNIQKRGRQTRSNLRPNQINNKQAFVNYKVMNFRAKGNNSNLMVYKTNNKKLYLKMVGNITIDQNRRRSNKSKVSIGHNIR